MDIYRQVIMDHYKRPHNFLNQDDTIEDTYIIRRGSNPSCGDEVQIYALVEDNVVKDLKFKGVGCSICCSSASVMTDELIGLTLEEAIEKIETFEELLIVGEMQDVFEDANAYAGIKDFPARYKCAGISWKTAKEILEEVKNEQ